LGSANDEARIKVEPGNKEEYETSVEYETSQRKPPQSLSTNKRNQASEETGNAGREPDTIAPYEPLHVWGEHARRHTTNEPHEGRGQRD
jgi:hypothetical protein